MAKSMNKVEGGEEEDSKRHFHWTTRVSSNNEGEATTATFNTIIHQEKDDESSSSSSSKPPPSTEKKESDREEAITKSKKLHAAVAVSRRLRSLFGRINLHQKRVVLGTLFGNKRGGHVHFFAIQKDPKLEPTLLIQLPTPITAGLVGEMASGSVRIVLESEKKGKKGGVVPLLEEPAWRAYRNGIECGLATRMECGANEWKILKAVEPISMGAGVLPSHSDDGMMMMMIYMRAKFERVVGSTDAEAYYMLNPDNNNNLNSTPPELTIYLLRL